MARNEKISSITLSDINKFENLIDTKGVAGTIEVYDTLQTKFGSGYAGWAKGVAAGNNTTGQEALAYLKGAVLDKP